MAPISVSVSLIMVDTADGLTLATDPYQCALLHGVNLILTSLALLNISYSGATRCTLHVRETTGGYTLEYANTKKIGWQRYSSLTDRAESLTDKADMETMMVKEEKK